MKYYKQIRDGSIISVGINIGGVEITEAEYNALLSEIRSKADLVNKLYAEEIAIEEVPADWQEEIQSRVEERIAYETEAQNEETSSEERIAELERENCELREALKALNGGVADGSQSIATVAEPDNADCLCESDAPIETMEV